jgi:FlaA1/EpsC-like NDP-sugar epimerase
MGATKRIAELLVSEAARVSGRCYLSVRFGNILSSRGSVLSIFREQIARGGPVTVTHPEMQSMLLGRGGEIFTLDMGEPLKIADIARDLIDLAGLRVGRDIALEFTGMQPGEKLSEELFLRRGHYEHTEHEKIFVSFNGKGVEPAYSGNRAFGEDLNEQLDALVDAARTGERPRILQQLKRIVPEYQIDNGLATLPALLEMS